MFRKVFILILATALFFPVLVVVPLNANAGSSPPPDDGIDGIQYIDGDWTVSDARTYSNEIIVLTGNLIVDPSGKLELMNTTLILNVTAVDGQFGIEVQNGGSLFINSTSLVSTGGSHAFGYDFTVDRDGILEINDSRVEYCGALGTGGASSGLTVRTNHTRFTNSSFSNCSNGLVADSVNLSVESCTFSDNNLNGILFTNITYPSNSISLIVSNSTISDNLGSGISAFGDRVTVWARDNEILRNSKGAIQVDGGLRVRANITDNHILENHGFGGVGLNAASAQGIIFANLTGNNLTDNGGISPVRLGFIVPGGSQGCNEPVKEIHCNATANVIWNMGGSESSQGDGLLMAFATDLIDIDLWDNIFFAPNMENGVHIGMISDEINLNAYWPGTEVVKADIHNCTISNIKGGALKVAASENMIINLTGNHIYHPDSKMACGSVSLGWFREAMDHTTPKHAEGILRDNIIEGISDSGGLGIKAIYNLNLTIENNTVRNVNNGGIILGWISDVDAKSTMPWAYPTRNVRAVISNNTILNGLGPGIWLYSSNGSVIKNNQIHNRSGSYIQYPTLLGDGIRIESTEKNTQIHDNIIFNCIGSAIRSHASTGLSIHDNLLVNNMYGLGLDSSSHNNILFNNEITKKGFQTGYYISHDSLNHSFPENNTVNGEWLRYYHDRHGTPSAPIEIQGEDVQEPLMSNLGQIIIANSDYLDIHDNTANYGTSGLSLINVNNSVVRDNAAGWNSDGIKLEVFSSRGQISGNNLTNNMRALSLESFSQHNLLQENVITKLSSGTGIFLDPAGTAWNNTILRNNVVNGAPVVYCYKNESVSIEDLNLSVPKITNFGQMVIVQSSGIDMSNITMENGFSGLYVRESDGIGLIGSFLRSNDRNIHSAVNTNLSISDSHLLFGTTGIYLDRSHGIVIDNVTVLNSTNSLHLMKSEIYALNSTIGNSSTYSILSASGSDIDLKNTTFERDKVSLATSNLSVSWYLDIQTLTNGFPVAGSNIRLSNDSVILGNYSTDDSGNVNDILIFEYSQYENTFKNCSTHHVNITSPGYAPHNFSFAPNRTLSYSINLADISAPLIYAAGFVPAISYSSHDLAWLNFTVDDHGKGNSMINDAEWLISRDMPNIIPGLGNSLRPLDDSFDSYNETFSIEVDISDFQAGNYTCWVRAADSNGNWCGWVSEVLSIVDNEGPAFSGEIIISGSMIGISSPTLWANASLDDSDYGGSNIGGVEARWNPVMGPDMPDILLSYHSRDGAINGVKEVIICSFDLSGVGLGNYTIDLRGLDELGNTGDWRSLNFSIIDDVAPEPPSNLALEIVKGGVQLTWEMNEEQDIAGYRIYRSVYSGSSYQMISSVDKESTAWVDDEVVPGRTYYYVITAFDDSAIPNESGFSDEQGITMKNKASYSIHGILALVLAIGIMVTVVLLKKPRPRSDAPEPESVEPPGEPEVEKEDVENS